MPKPNGWTGENWQGRKPGPYKWYEIQDTVAYYKEFEGPKIVYAEIATKGQFWLDDNGFYCDTTAYILGSDSRYLLGILNSRLWNFLFKTVSSEIRGGFLRWKRQYMAPLPIRTINPSDSADRAMHDEMVALVERMLRLHGEKEQAGARPAGELEGDIRRTDAAIDALVYRLYGLTDEEIKIVEGTV